MCQSYYRNSSNFAAITKHTMIVTTYNSKNYDIDEDMNF